MAQLRASDVNRGIGRGRNRGRGRSTGPPRSRVPNPLEDIESYINHGWWITARRHTDAAPLYGVLHNSHRSYWRETIYSGLADEYGTIVHIASPRHDGDGSFYIRAKIGAPDRTYQYRLHRDHMMQPIPLALMQFRPALAGLRSAQGWWLRYDEETQNRRMQVTRICGNLSLEERKHCLAYMARHNAAARMLLPHGGTSGASTSSAPPSPVPEVVPYPEETDPMYRWFAFPVNAPLRGAPRPARVFQERYLPFDPDGRRGRVGYRLVMPLASMPLQDMPDVFDDEEPLPVSDPGSDDDAGRTQRAPTRVIEVTLPTEAKLEEGYVYGRDFRWLVPITQVRQPVGPLTNQRILNVQNAFDVYRLLSSAAHEDVSCLTLRPIEYRPPGEGSHMTFGGAGGREAFISKVTAWATREAIDPPRVSSEVHRFLAHVTWEPVDGQHIIWACQHIAQDEHERGTLWDDVYDRFLQRPATVLVYDDPRFFMSESRHTNVHHCSRQRYTTVAENLTKMRELWEFYGQPGTGVGDATRRAAFLSCISATVHSPAVPTSGSVKVMKLIQAFRDYLPHVQHTSQDDWDAIMRVYRDYDQVHTHYSLGDAKRWKVYSTKATDDPTIKKPSRPQFAIGWLRPLTSLESADYCALCAQVSKPEGDRAQQRTWFGGPKNTELAHRTVFYKAERVRTHYAVRNAIRWLEVRANPIAISLEDFRRLFIGEPLVDAKTINFFVDQVGTEFLKGWATPLARSVPKMAQVEHLIPACIIAHNAAKTRGEAGYVAGKWVSEGAPKWR